MRYLDVAELVEAVGRLPQEPCDRRCSTRPVDAGEPELTLVELQVGANIVTSAGMPPEHVSNDRERLVGAQSPRAGNLPGAEG